MSILPSNHTLAALRERIKPLMQEMTLTSPCYIIPSQKDGPVSTDSLDRPEYFITIPGAMIQIPMLERDALLEHLENLQTGKNGAPNSLIVHIEHTVAHTSKMVVGDIIKDVVQKLEGISNAFMPEGSQWRPIITP